MNRYPAEWERLSQFLGCYFNQDFYEIYGPPDEVLATYLREAPPETVAETAVLAERLARHPMEDEELVRLLDALGLEYAPDAEGWTHRAWLEHVARTLRAGLSGGSSR